MKEAHIKILFVEYESFEKDEAQALFRQSDLNVDAMDYFKVI